MGAVHRDPQGAPAVTERLRIGVYAIAKNEARNVPRWAASSTDADVRVVTDTGSTDGTVELLQASGVTVAHGCPCPWRWDDAHTMALYHLPVDVDVCVRLDLDEVLVPGWRELIERHWTHGIGVLHHGYEWAPGSVISQERVHSRVGYRWRQATHEGLVRWDGEPDVRGHIDGEGGLQAVLIRQDRPDRKPHQTDMRLCERAVAEAPTDARAHWYLARERFLRGDDRARGDIEKYLDMPGGSSHERAYALRAMAHLDRGNARQWLLRAVAESPSEPEPWVDLAHDALTKGDPVAALTYARRACQADRRLRNHASDDRAWGPEPRLIAAKAAALVNMWPEAMRHVEEARRLGADSNLVDAMVEMLGGAYSPNGPKQ